MSKRRLDYENLFVAVADQTATADQIAELNDWLRDNPVGQRQYLEFMDLEHEIERHLPSMSGAHQTTDGEANVDGKFDLQSGSRVDVSRSRVDFARSNVTQPRRLRSVVPIALALASSVALLVAAAFLYSARQSTVTQTARLNYSIAEALVDADATDVSENLYVAQVTRITPEVVWSNNSALSDFLLRTRVGDRLSFKSGLVGLEYFSGAKLILHGPCSFVLTSSKSGRLERGQLTENVEGGDFFVSTPSARVLDLGTEFGMSFVEDEGTSVCVFDGEVKLFGNSGINHEDILSLSEGMSASVKRDGRINRTNPVDVSKFARRFPDQLSKVSGQLSLVDLLSVSSAETFRLAGVIAPDTGKADQSPWLKPVGPGHRMSAVYRATDWHPFVDGVFIPSKTGNEVQIDSTGRTIDLPQSLGRTWGPVWSRRKFQDEITSSDCHDYWGTSTLEGVVKRINRCETGMIGIHSNVGVTFDLVAIRRQLDFSPTALTFIAGNLDNSMAMRPDWARQKRFSADLRVYVDGELRAKRLDFTRHDGELEMNVSLKESDRFLTSVSSDAGRDGFDHIVVIDPVLSSK